MEGMYSGISHNVILMYETNGESWSTQTMGNKERSQSMEGVLLELSDILM